MVKTKLNYHGYELLFPYEALAAVGYMERCDPLPLSELIKSDIVLSQGMKDFIADIIAGKLTRPKHKRGTTERRDFDIYLAVRDLMNMGETEENAIAQAALKFYLSEDGIDSASKRIKKKHFK